MKGIVTNIALTGNGYVNVTVTATTAGGAVGSQSVTATVPVAIGTQPQLGAVVEITLSVVG